MDTLKTSFLVLFLVAMGLRVFAQDPRAREQSGSPSRHVISGYLRSKASGESIARASVTVVGQQIGVSSNDYGFYSISLPAGKYTLLISAVGMKSERIDIVLDGDRRIETPMEAQGALLQDVTVVSQPRGRTLTGTQMGVEQLSTKEIRDIPVLFGERDVLKTLQLLPGVKPVSQGNSGLSVRGGSSDQNLVLLDEAPVYNASHLLGFFSTFNSDAIKDVTLYKGGMPAQYGGRLSSVVDVRMNEGNNQDFHVNGGIGLISAKLNLEGPIEKGRSSFLISARRTYADMFLKLSNDSTINKNSLYFYDLNAKINVRLSDHDRLYLSGYFGRDNLASSDIFGLNWGNATGTLRWNHVFGPRVFSNTSLIYSYYNYKLRVNNNGSHFDVLSELRDWNIKEELQFYLNPRNNIRIGFNSIYHSLNPGVLTGGSESGVNDTSFQKRVGLENAAFINNSWRLSERWNISYGARLTVFGAQDTVAGHGRKLVRTYWNPELRMSLSYQLNTMATIKASYADNTQHMHLISSSNAGFPTDQWLVTNSVIQPERSHQVSLGFYTNLREDRYELTVETYYKTLGHQIDYKDGANLLGNGMLETELLYGKGRAYGVEGLLRKKTGRLTGWLGYTWSRSQKQIAGINEGAWYNATVDRPHDISVVGMYKLNAKWLLAANWVYTTGNAVSLPSGKYKEDGRTIYYYSERNGYRMPAYHRLDLSATVQLRQHPHFSQELAFGVYNAYNRDNAFIISFRDNKTNPDKTEAVQTTLFGAVPYISYNFKF